MPLSMEILVSEHLHTYVSNQPIADINLTIRSVVTGRTGQKATVAVAKKAKNKSRDKRRRQQKKKKSDQEETE